MEQEYKEIADKWGIKSPEMLDKTLSTVADISAVMTYLASGISGLIEAESPEVRLEVANKLVTNFDREKYSSSITLGCILAATAVFTSTQVDSYERKYVLERYVKLLEKHKADLDAKERELKESINND